VVAPKILYSNRSIGWPSYLSTSLTFMRHEAYGTAEHHGGAS